MRRALRHPSMFGAPGAIQVATTPSALQVTLATHSRCQPKGFRTMTTATASQYKSRYPLNRNRPTCHLPRTNLENGKTAGTGLRNAGGVSGENTEGGQPESTSTKPKGQHRLQLPSCSAVSALSCGTSSDRDRRSDARGPTSLNADKNGTARTQ